MLRQNTLTERHAMGFVSRDIIPLINIETPTPFSLALTGSLSLARGFSWFPPRSQVSSGSASCSLA